MPTPHWGGKKEFYMKKIEFLALLILTIFVSCTSNNTNRPINAIPEYGHQEKSEMQLQADQNFSELSLYAL